MKRSPAVFLCLISCFLLSGLIALGETNDEYFFGNTGMIRYQNYPHDVSLPKDKSELENYWFQGKYGVFYAPGTGVEITLQLSTSMDEHVSFLEVKDYSGFQPFFYNTYVYDIENETITTPDDTLIITRLSEDVISVEFTDLWEQTQQHDFSFEGNTLELTRANVFIEKKDGDDVWEGSYESWDSYADMYTYITVLPIYYSGDYLLVYQTEKYGEPQDKSSGYYMTEMEDMLVHPYPPGEIYPYVTYVVMGKDENNSLVRYDGSYTEDDFSVLRTRIPDETYIKNGSGRMWK